MIKSPEEKGSVYHLYKVGFFLVPEDQLSQAPAKAQVFGGKKLLPTGVIDFEGKKVLCRLPLEFSALLKIEWIKRHEG